MLAKNVYSESNHEETSNKPNLRDILQKKSVLFKNVMVMKDKARLRSSSRLKGTRDMTTNCNV